MNKYKVIMLSIFILIMLSITYTNGLVNEFPLLGKRLYLDAGHGGIDPGAYINDIYEEDINLQIVEKLKTKLESMGATIYLTRNGDYDLSEPNASLRKKSDLSNRANLINKSNVDMYLSIHLNSYPSSYWSGAQAFYDDINKKNKHIAEVFQDYFNKYLGSNRQPSEISTLYMYKNIKIPGVLLEVGFISNEKERSLLITNEYQYAIVDTIANALCYLLN